MEMADFKTEQKILERVRNLLAKANDPRVSAAEREVFLDEANRRINKHAIDMALLDASRTIGEKRKPTKKHIVLFDQGFEWGSQFMSVIMSICETNRCRYAFHNGYRSITVVGMQEDVDWVEMLWLNVFFYFSSQIQPRWDVESSVAENIYNFKNAGYKWKDIWEIGYQAIGSMPDGETFFNTRKSKYMITGYKKMCAEKGTQPIGTQTFKAYKLTFTNHFTYEVNRRLEEMRDANKKQEVSTSGSELALFDVSKLIEQELYRLFPELSPEARAKRDEIWRKEEADAEAADAAYLASLSPAARKAVLDKRSREEAAAARRADTFYRNQSKRRTYDAAGATAGSAAGREVDLTRNGKATDAGSKKELN
jgi:hypothetical protein